MNNEDYGVFVCGNCGGQLDPLTMICKNCGFSHYAKKEIIRAEIATRRAESRTEERKEEQRIEIRERKQKSHNKTLIAIALLALIFGCCLGSNLFPVIRTETQYQTIEVPKEVERIVYRDRIQTVFENQTVYVDRIVYEDRIEYITNTIYEEKIKFVYLNQSIGDLKGELIVLRIEPIQGYLCGLWVKPDYVLVNAYVYNYDPQYTAYNTTVLCDLIFEDGTVWERTIEHGNLGPSTYRTINDKIPYDKPLKYFYGYLVWQNNLGEVFKKSFLNLPC